MHEPSPSTPAIAAGATMQAHRAAWPWAVLWLSAALLLAACSAAPTGRADRASARTAAAELANPPARSQPHYVAQAQSTQQASYRWHAGQGDGAGGLSIRAAGSAAMEVPLLQGCQRAAGASGAPQE